MQRTLLLTCGYEPIRVISWQRAIRLLFLEKAEVVETWDWSVRTICQSFRVPAVVRLLTSFSLHQQRIKFSRHNVLARDRYRCQYCGEKHPAAKLTLDHVIPKSRGGKTDWTNIVTACKACNFSKRDRTPEEAHMKLRKEPKRPRWLPFMGITSRRGVPRIWIDYCGTLLKS